MWNWWHIWWSLAHWVHSHGWIMWHAWVPHHEGRSIHCARPHRGVQEAAPATPAKQPPSKRLPRRGTEGHQRFGFATGREQRGQEADRLPSRPIRAASQPGTLRRLVRGGGDGANSVPRRQLHEGRGLRQGKGERLGGGRSCRRIPARHGDPRPTDGGAESSPEAVQETVSGARGPGPGA